MSKNKRCNQKARCVAGLYAYGLFLVCGLSLALFLAYFKIKKNDLDFEKIALAISICSFSLTDFVRSGSAPFHPCWRIL